MRVGISTTASDTDALLTRVRAAPAMTGATLASEVSTGEPYLVEAVGPHRFVVAAVDLGIKAMTPHRLSERGIDVVVLPATCTIDDVVEVGADGVFFSNGPGDPSTADGPIAVLRGVLERRIPYFGICFGHQLFGRALGLPTYKLKYGHRGINQPVLDSRTGRVEVTAHNHGFAVKAPSSVPFDTAYGSAEVTHRNLNDDVVEGLRLVERPAFSVQYHPEAAAGPHDADHLFDQFADLMAADARLAAAPPAGRRVAGAARRGGGDA